MQPFLWVALAGSAALNLILLTRGHELALKVRTLLSSRDYFKDRCEHLRGQVDSLTIALRNANGDRAALSDRLIEFEQAEQRRHAIRSAAVSKGNRARSAKRAEAAA